MVELRGGPRGPGPPERPDGPLETSGLRGYKGASERPPEITRQIQYMIATYQYHYKLTNRNKTIIESWLVEKLVARPIYFVYNCLYMKLRLASLAHVHGVSVAVHNHGRFVWVTAHERPAIST